MTTQQNVFIVFTQRLHEIYQWWGRAWQRRPGSRSRMPWRSLFYCISCRLVLGRWVLGLLRKDSVIRVRVQSSRVWRFRGLCLGNCAGYVLLVFPSCSRELGEFSSDGADEEKSTWRQEIEGSYTYLMLILSRCGGIRLVWDLVCVLATFSLEGRLLLIEDHVLCLCFHHTVSVGCFFFFFFPRRNKLAEVWNLLQNLLSLYPFTSCVFFELLLVSFFSFRSGRKWLRKTAF